MNNDATGTTVRWGYQSIHWSCCGLQLQPPAHRLSPTYRDKRRNHKLSVSPTQDYLFASLQTGFNCKYFRPKKKESWVSLQWHTEGEAACASHWKRGNARFRCWCLQHHTRSCWTAADRGELWERGRFTVRSRSFVVFPLDPPTLPLACLLSTDKLIRQGLAWKGVVTFPPLFVLSP